MVASEGIYEIPVMFKKFENPAFYTMYSPTSIKNFPRKFENKTE
jgi:hypothetical protein